MAGLIRMSLDSPEEARPFAGDSGQLDLVNLAAGPQNPDGSVPHPGPAYAVGRNTGCQR